MTAVPRFGRHLAFYLAAAAALMVLPIAYWLQVNLAVQMAANAFFLVYLGMIAWKLPRLSARFLKAHASSADEPVAVIFAVTAGTVVVAIGSLFLLINTEPGAGALRLGLALSSVTLGWLTIHTMAAMHYAHSFWGATSTPASRGMAFPGTEEPEGFDFVYFAFVIGMTAQTSDVSITNTAMRRINLVHAVVSYFFNAVLIAAAVNLAVSLGS